MKKILLNTILITTLFTFGGWINVVNAQKIDISLHQIDARFSVSAKKAFTTLGEYEEYYYYVQNNTDQEYKLVVVFTLEIACVGSKTHTLGFSQFVYLKPNSRFEPKDDYYRSSNFVTDKKCWIKNGNSFTLLKQISYTISSVVNVTEQKAQEKKNKEEAETKRLQKLEDDKKAKEALAKADADKKASDALAKTEADRIKAKAESDKKAKEVPNQTTNSNGQGNNNSNRSSSTNNNYNTTNSNSNNGNYGAGTQTNTAEANRIANDNAKRKWEADVAAETKRVTDLNNARRAAENVRSEQIQSLNNSVNDWASNMASEAEARRQREYAQQERREEAEERKAEAEKEARVRAAEAARVRAAEAARVEAERQRVVASRKALITNFPDGKTPLSYQAKENSEVYFFVYSHQTSSLEDNFPKIYISNVFSVSKFGDGTWPFKTGLMENIAKTNKGLPLILSGYYLSENEAEQQQQGFVNKANRCGFSVNTIQYTSKKASPPTSVKTDYWGEPGTGEKKETPAKQNEIDFWGNPVKKTSGNEEKKNGDSKTPASPAKKEMKYDFWGNPIKE